MARKIDHKRNDATGRRAEDNVTAYLNALGYTILSRRLRTPYGEIDILALDKNTLVVIEVKARASLETASEALSSKQCRRLERAILFFISQNPDYNSYDIRFDLVWKIDHTIHHIPSAWMSMSSDLETQDFIF